MPLPLLVPLIAEGVSSAVQIGMGISDRVKGKKKLAEAQSFYEKNKYQIPESAKASLGVAGRQASTLRLPGEDIYRSRIGEATSAGVGAAKEAATSASDVLSVLSGLYGQQMGAEQDMALAGAERYDRNQAQLQSSLNMMADLERERWQYTSLFPYQQMLGQAEAYQTRGAQGISSGLSSLGQAAGQYAQLSSAEQQYQDYLGTMGLQSPYYGMNNKQKTEYIGAQEARDINRQGAKLNPNYTPPTGVNVNYRTSLLG